MDLTSEWRKAELRNYLSELLRACPFDPQGAEDCPLAALRQMEAADQARWLKALEEDDLEFLIAYHNVCIDTKVELQLAQGQDAPPAP
jgi:hypothetical protein